MKNSITITAFCGIAAFISSCGHGKKENLKVTTSYNANESTALIPASLSQEKVIEEYQKLYGQPLESELAKKFIEKYKEHTVITYRRCRHVWVDTITLKYLYDLFLASKMSGSRPKMDGFRIYLADYDRTMQRRGGPSYPKNTRTLIFVPTLGIDTSYGLNNTTYHLDWYDDDKNNIITPKVYDYSDPCPPGEHCDVGARLGKSSK